MAAPNIDAIYSKAGDIQWTSAAITAANTARDGTGTINTVFIADATNGGYVNRIRFRSLGGCVATCGRIFINNGSTHTTAANNVLWDEITLAATSSSETAALAIYELPVGFALPAGYRLHAVLGTAVSAGYMVSAIGGKY